MFKGWFHFWPAVLLAFFPFLKNFNSRFMERIGFYITPNGQDINIPKSPFMFRLPVFYTMNSEHKMAHFQLNKNHNLVYRVANSITLAAYAVGADLILSLHIYPNIWVRLGVAVALAFVAILVWVGFRNIFLKTTRYRVAFFENNQPFFY